MGPDFGSKGTYVREHFDPARYLSIRIGEAGMSRFLSLGVMISALACTQVYAQSDKAQIIAECDRLAASDVDPDRPSTISGVPTNAIDPAIAVPACEAAVAVAGDDRRIVFQLGRAYDAAKVYDKAHAQYERAEALGHLVAANNLGGLYAQGHGVAQDWREARRLFEKAALAGLPRAMRNLGWLYLNGHGVLRDYATAPSNGILPDFDTNYFARGYAPRTIGATMTYRF